MPEVMINDQKLEAEIGESILSVARRNASVISFLCNGRGICQTCECRVISGAEHLNKPSEIEQKTMSHSRRKRGYRLACLTTIVGPGPVDVISELEQLRRQSLNVLSPPRGTKHGEHFERLFNQVTRFALDFTSSLPSIAVKAVPRAITRVPSIHGVQNWLYDTHRTIQTIVETSVLSNEKQAQNTPKNSDSEEPKTDQKDGTESV